MKERRRYKRYAMPRGTFAILRNELEQLQHHRRMSIGEIAMVLYKSDTRAMGQVMDMSLGSVAFDGGDQAVPMDCEVELDLLMAEKGLYIHNIPFDAGPDRSSGKVESEDVRSRITVLRFKDLDTTLKDQLRELLACRVG